jgi:glyoxylate reductase
MVEKQVFVTRKLPGDAFEELREICDVVNSPEDRPLTRKKLLDSLTDVDGIVATLSDVIDGEVMAKAGSSLAVVSNYAVGYNNIDVSEATKRKVIVCNTPDVLTDATADMAFTMLLAIARDVPRAHEFTVKGHFKGWDPNLFLGLPVWGKTVGIVGMGKIGSAIARRARGFDMEVLYHNKRRVDPSRERELGAEHKNLHELLKLSDFVVLAVSLSDETRGLIGREELALMKRDACLINICRGEVIKEAELVDALEKGVIKGAALDVYEKEPEIHRGLVGLENVVLLPHLGSATKVAREKMARLCVENLLAVFRGEKPPAGVNDHLI